MPALAAWFCFIDMIAAMISTVRMRAAALGLLLASAAAAPVFAAGEAEAAIVVDLLLRSGIAPLKLMSSKPLCVQADPAEIYREPFISGAGTLTRVVSLEYQFRMQRNDARGLLLELTPVSHRFTPPRRMELPRDGRSRLLTVWRDDASGDEAIFSVRMAEPDEALLACTLRRPVVRPLYHLRATIEQAGPGYDPSRSSPQFTAPLGEESSQHFVNSQPRRIERKQAGSPAAGPVPPPQPQLQLSPGIAVRDFGASGATAPLTTTATLVNPGPAETPATPPAAADSAATGAPEKPAAAASPEPPEVVIVEDRDDFTITVKADRAGERLMIRVTATGSLATATQRRAAVSMTQIFTVFRHEPMSLYITGDGALHSYTMSFDPDWEEQ